jgi:hypothetical protein
MICSAKLMAMTVLTKRKKKLGLAMKILRSESRFAVSPAYIAGVLTSCPNFSAL